MKKIMTAAMLALVAVNIWAAEPSKDEGFVQLFGGKSLDGWKCGESPESWTLKDGEIICKGRRSHLYYVGDEKPFVNFELRVDVMTEPKANGGIYFHTKFQDEGFPVKGFEAQVNNSHGDPKRTGSLYNVVDVLDVHLPDNQWYTETIIVKGKQVVIKINDKVVVDYTEPADKKPTDGMSRIIDKGVFALQAHDPGSVVHFKNIRVKRLD